MINPLQCCEKCRLVNVCLKGNPTLQNDLIKMRIYAILLNGGTRWKYKDQDI